MEQKEINLSLSRDNEDLNFRLRKKTRDSYYDSSFYTYLLNSLTKKGKYGIMERAFAKEFKRISELDIGIESSDPDYIMSIVFEKLQSFVEVKTFKRKKKTYVVPFFVHPSRYNFLARKWLVEGALQDKVKGSLAEKIGREIVSIILEKNSKALDIKKYHLKQAMKNKSNIHFRW